MEGHTVASFDQDLRLLAEKVSAMGKAVEAQVADVAQALAEGNAALASEVAGADAAIDTLQREIETMGVQIIATRQPVAVDLREIVGALRIAGDLERIGDLAKNIGKRAAAFDRQGNLGHMGKGVTPIAGMAVIQLRDVMDSYAGRDLAKADAVWRSDRELDSLYTSVFRELLTYMMEDVRNITVCTHMLFCAKNIERIGDHTTNIAENVHYIATGAMPAGPRPKIDDAPETGGGA
jgi:phosphate transport system protein